MTLTITGPYQYQDDVHPSFNLSDDRMIIASFYIPDGDENAAYDRADIAKAALEVSEQKRMKGRGR